MHCLLKGANMSAENISNEYIKSIERLAKKNNIPLDAMIKYWKNKYETFNDITDKYDFHYDEKFYPKDSSRPFIALTVNGSIIIASAPNNGLREIQYLPIEIRNDGSNSVPQKTKGKLADHLEYLEKADFENLFSTSPVIRIKTADELNREIFEEKTAQFTKEITDAFTKINEDITNTATKINTENTAEIEEMQI